MLAVSDPPSAPRGGAGVEDVDRPRVLRERVGERDALALEQAAPLEEAVPRVLRRRQLRTPFIFQKEISGWTSRTRSA